MENFFEELEKKLKNSTLSKNDKAKLIQESVNSYNKKGTYIQVCTKFC